MKAREKQRGGGGCAIEKIEKREVKRGGVKGTQGEETTWPERGASETNNFSLWRKEED